MVVGTSWSNSPPGCEAGGRCMARMPAFWMVGWLWRPVHVRMVSTKMRIYPGHLTVLLLCLLHRAGDAQDPETSSYDPRHGPWLHVTTILIEPYVMIDHNHRNATNGGYKGYIVDLIDKVADIVGFKYRLVPVRDGTYGYRRSDGTWNGMVGELVAKKADLAAAPLYITNHRANAVDFTHPFIEVEATILLRRPRTGQDAAIKSAYDLLNQSEYKYGTLNTGVIIRAFRTSNDTLHRMLWQNMRVFQPPVFTKSNAAGIHRVRHEKYGYILPSTIADYVKTRMPCDLVTVDRFLIEKGYGLAVEKGSGLLPKLNRALTILKSMGFLDEIKHKWWVKTSECNGIKSSKIYSLNKGSSQDFQTVVIILGTVVLFFIT